MAEHMQVQRINSIVNWEAYLPKYRIDHRHRDHAESPAAQANIKYKSFVSFIRRLLLLLLHQK